MYAVNDIDVGTGIGSNVKVDVSQIVIDNACICTLTALTELKHKIKFKIVVVGTGSLLNQFSSVSSGCH